jgi:hypothetical protein
MSEKCRFCCKSLFGVSAKIFQGSSCVFARGDMRGYIVSHKNRHGASHRLYRVLQWRSRLKIDFREILGPGRFPTFATKSARSGRSRAAAVEPVIPERWGEAQANPESIAQPCAALRGPRATKQRPFCARRPPATSGRAEASSARLPSTPDQRAGRRRVAATYLNRVSPSGTRSRSRGAPLPRPAPWRAA